MYIGEHRKYSEVSSSPDLQLQSIQPYHTTLAETVN